MKIGSYEFEVERINTTAVNQELLSKDILTLSSEFWNWFLWNCPHASPIIESNVGTLF